MSAAHVVPTFPPIIADTCRALGSIVDQVLQLDLVAIEDAGLAAAQEGSQKLLGLTRDAHVLMGTLIDALDALNDAEDSSSVAGMAFVARMTLAQEAATLDAARASGDFWRNMDALGATKHELVRSMDRLLAEVAAAGAIPYQRRLVLGQLETALESRYAYYRFAESVQGNAPIEGEALAARLRTIANSIARLMGRDVYPHTRVADRQALHGVRARLRETLAAFEPSPAWVQTAQRLFQDAVNLGQFFMEINQRAEIIEHDVDLLERLLKEAQRGRPCDELCKLAKPLLGVDERLDALLEARAANRDDLCQCLKEIHLVKTRTSSPDPFAQASPLFG